MRLLISGSHIDTIMLLQILNCDTFGESLVGKLGFTDQTSATPGNIQR